MVGARIRHSQSTTEEGDLTGGARPCRQYGSTLARGQKSHSITLAPPYNPHSVAARRPLGSVQQGLSALSRRSCSSDRVCSADETQFVSGGIQSGRTAAGT